MTTPVDATPAQYQGVIPYLVVEDPAAAIEFYKNAFGAAETLRLKSKDGAILHAELRIGSATLMLSREWPDMGHHSPKHYGGVALSLCIYVPDVDSLAVRAEAAGAVVIQPVENKFYGDRAVTLRDPAGYVWAFMTHVEDVPPDELQRRVQSM